MAYLKATAKDHLVTSSVFLKEGYFLSQMNIKLWTHRTLENYMPLNLKGLY